MIVPAPTQSTYQQYETVAQVGMPGSMVPWSIDSRILEDPTGNGAGFGLAVCQGYKTDKGCTLGALSGGGFVGVTRADPTIGTYTTPLPNGQPRAVDKFYDTDNVPVVTLGDIWVQPVGAVSAGNPAYFNSVTGQLGGSGIPNAVQIPDSIWITSLPRPASTTLNWAGLAIVRLGHMV